MFRGGNVYEQAAKVYREMNLYLSCDLCQGRFRKNHKKLTQTKCLYLVCKYFKM